MQSSERDYKCPRHTSIKTMTAIRTVLLVLAALLARQQLAFADQYGPVAYSWHDEIEGGRYFGSVSGAAYGAAAYACSSPLYSCDSSCALSSVELVQPSSWRAYVRCDPGRTVALAVGATCDQYRLPNGTLFFSYDSALNACAAPDGNLNQVKQQGTPKQCVGNPCDPATGNKYLQETDYAGDGAYPLDFGRYYNSLFPGVGAISYGWRTTYDRGVQFDPNSSTVASVQYANGGAVTFRLIGATWTPPSDVSDRLVKVGDAWQLINARDEIESYDSTGRLASISNRAELQKTLTYFSSGTNSGLLQSVTDSFGRTLIFSYNNKRLLATMTDPAGGTYDYTYDANNRLSTVTFPDGKTKTYVYNESANTSGANLPYALTGIVDENANRFATYKYSAQRQAISTEHAGGANLFTFTYNSDGTTRVTDSFNSSRTYTFSISNGISRNTGISTPACPSCGPTATTYNANGYWRLALTGTVTSPHI